MSHIKVLPIVPVKQAETFDDEIDEQQHLRKWLSSLQRVESAKRSISENTTERYPSDSFAPIVASSSRRLACRQRFTGHL